MTDARKSRARFFQDDDLDFVFLIVLGGAYDRVADVGACLAIADRIEDGNAASAYEVFVDAGERLATIAGTAAAAGRRTSAREAYLQAANYTFAATYFADAMGAPERFAPTCSGTRRCGTPVRRCSILPWSTCASHTRTRPFPATSSRSIVRARPDRC